MQIPTHLPIPDKREFWSILDSTKLQSYARCPRRYFLEYVLGWASDAISNHLVFGQAWHVALEHLYRGHFGPEGVPGAYDLFMQTYRRELPPDSDGLFKGKQPGIVPQALLEYLMEWAADAYTYKVLGSEVGGVVPISNERSIALKIDLICEDEKGVLAIEHKTGSQAGRTWEMQWATSLQIGTYLHALACSYVDSPEQARIFVNGTFFYTKDRKFVRIMQRRAGWAMLDWLDTVNGLWDGIEADFHLLSLCDPGESNLRAFRKNASGCTDYGGCPFFDVCTVCGNPLRYAQPVETEVGVIPGITGFKYRWWNPLEEVKEEIIKEK